MITKINAYIYTHTNVFKKKKKIRGAIAPWSIYASVPAIFFFFFENSVPAIETSLVAFYCIHYIVALILSPA